MKSNVTRVTGATAITKANAIAPPYIEKKTIKKSSGRADSIAGTNRTMQRERVYMPDIGKVGNAFKYRR